MEVQNKYKIISTGSHGNCIIYHNSIMVDIGVPFSKIKPFLHDIRLVVLTHSHFDHINISTLKKIVFERPTVRIFCGDWMLPYLEGIKNVDVCEIGKIYDYGGFKISPVKTFHDVPSMGVRIYMDGLKFIHITDTSTLEGITAKDYDAYFLEHNYSEETVMQVIQEREARGQYAHQRGAVNSHLSWEQANDFFFKNKGENSVLIRLHESKTSL